jgi:hypothetical protein
MAAKRAIIERRRYGKLNIKILENAQILKRTSTEQREKINCALTGYRKYYPAIMINCFGIVPYLKKADREAVNLQTVRRACMR